MTMAAGPVNIRPFRRDDLESLQSLRTAAFAPIFHSFREILGPGIAEVALASAEAEQNALLERLCEAKESQRVLVAECGSTPAGFVCLTLDREKGIGEISLNAVHPEFAGRGIGTRLYERALEIMKGAGMRVATVGVGGDLSHAAARRAYEKAGFGPSIPSLWMYREL